MPKNTFSPAKRRRIYERDQYQCWYCGKQLSRGIDTSRWNYLPAVTQALVPTIDHLEPRVRGGFDLDSNLVTACRDCNSRKGRKTLEEYREYLQTKGSNQTRALRHIEAAISEASTPFDEDLQRIADWIRGETARIVFWGERRPSQPPTETLCKATSFA